MHREVSESRRVYNWLCLGSTDSDHSPPTSAMGTARLPRSSTVPQGKPLFDRVSRSEEHSRARSRSPPIVPLVPLLDIRLQPTDAKHSHQPAQNGLESSTHRLLSHAGKLSSDEDASEIDQSSDKEGKTFTGKTNGKAQHLVSDYGWNFQEAFDALAFASTWLMLAGFLILPGSFESSGYTMLAAATLCSGLGLSVMLYLWSAQWDNPAWLVRKVFIPGLFNAVLGALSTGIHIYGVNEGHFTTTSRAALIIISTIAGANLALLLSYGADSGRLQHKKGRMVQCESCVAGYGKKLE
ncbi:hypothetical protein DFP72DRAFT_882760 [Ephemerocybe angulata]|uniref:Uncharacterized protein n=1 Tax=Ephemerocybe angulata TaxID=980116 RepID=A0A8H6MCA6_9AGAR|nr:hypothetical protein DFP72DRAFT_882760 [Tulosesus angulatus]